MTELRYLQSAASWDEALPLGNGRLGRWCSAALPSSGCS